VIVVDASVMVEIVLRTETGNRLWTRLRDRSETLHAPHVIDLEVANASGHRSEQDLRRHSVREIVTGARLHGIALQWRRRIECATS